MAQVSVTLRKRRSRCCAEGVQLTLPAERAQSLSLTLQALAHPVRLQILHILAHYEGKVCVYDLEAALPVKQPTVSHHLNILREAGLVDSERRGLWAYYFIRREETERILEELNETLRSLVSTGGKP